jgi:hypothetical protein
MSVRLTKSELIGVGWTAWVVVALLMLPLLGGSGYVVLMAVSALIVAAIPGAVCGSHVDAIVRTCWSSPPSTSPWSR